MTAVPRVVDGPVVVVTDVLSPASCERVNAHYAARYPVDEAANPNRLCVGIDLDAGPNRVFWAIADLVAPHVVALNAELWHLERLGVHGSAQMLRYPQSRDLERSGVHGLGCERHADGVIDSRFRWLGTATYLTDSSDYEGGELLIDGSTAVVFVDRTHRVIDRLEPVRHGDHALRPPLGSTAIFPGHVEHEVRPVHAGRRHAFAMFFQDSTTAALKPRPGERSANQSQSQLSPPGGNMNTNQHNQIGASR